MKLFPLAGHQAKFDSLTTKQNDFKPFKVMPPASGPGSKPSSPGHVAREMKKNHSVSAFEVTAKNTFKDHFKTIKGEEF